MIMPTYFDFCTNQLQDEHKRKRLIYINKLLDSVEEEKISDRMVEIWEKIWEIWEIKGNDWPSSEQFRNVMPPLIKNQQYVDQLEMFLDQLKHEIKKKGEGVFMFKIK